MSQDVDKVIAACKYIGVKSGKLDVKNFYAARFLIQKITSLSKSAGIPINYRFTLYIKGPYSRQLTNDYYANREKFTSLETNYQLTKGEKELLDKIYSYILDYTKLDSSIRLFEFIESSSTIAYLMTESGMMDDTAIIKKVKELKPYLNESETIVGLNRVKCLLFKPEYLTDEIREETMRWDSLS